MGLVSLTSCPHEASNSDQWLRKRLTMYFRQLSFPGGLFIPKHYRHCRHFTLPSRCFDSNSLAACTALKLSNVPCERTSCVWGCSCFSSATSDPLKLLWFFPRPTLKPGNAYKGQIACDYRVTPQALSLYRILVHLVLCFHSSMMPFKMIFGDYAKWNKPEKDNMISLIYT